MTNTVMVVAGPTCWRLAAGCYLFAAPAATVAADAAAVAVGTTGVAAFLWKAAAAPTRDST